MFTPFLNISPKTENLLANIGFENLPNQVLRKYLKRGFNFTFMVVGESGLGKSTLINSLFQADFYDTTITPGITLLVKPQKTVKLETSTVDILEENVKLSLTLVDTPGFGNGINNSDNFTEILNYIEVQNEKFLSNENSLNRKNNVDTRVHCCFYFISPFGHGLKPLDIELMKKLCAKVNIIPIIGKADSLTKNEVLSLKEQILKEIKDNEINIYQIYNNDNDESKEYEDLNKRLQLYVPFAVCGANSVMELDGKLVYGRVYPWGLVNIENPDHCEFTHLRTMLITHLQDLKDLTQEIFYENYRYNRITANLSNRNLNKRSKVQLNKQI